MTDTEYFKNLSNTMYLTRGARFNAARRLAAREKFSVGSIAFLSVFMAMLSVLLLSAPDAFTLSDTRFVSILTIVLSISLVVLSLLDYASNWSVKAFLLHKNALQISELMRRLELELYGSNANASTLGEIAMEYEAAVSETQINHLPKDHYKFALSKASSKNFVANIYHWIRSHLYCVYYWISEFWLQLVIILVPAILVVHRFYWLRFHA